MRVGIVGAAALLCLAAMSAAAEAQRGGKIQRIGMISTLPLSTYRELRTTQALLAALHDLGYDEGRNFVLEYRSTEGGRKTLSDLALRWSVSRLM